MLNMAEGVARLGALATSPVVAPAAAAQPPHLAPDRVEVVRLERRRVEWVF